MDKNGYSQEMKSDRKVYITDLMRKYFTPIEISFDPSNYHLKPGTDVDAYIEQEKEKHATYREVSQEMNLYKYKNENGEFYYHPDYDFQEYTSRILFKKSFDILSPEEDVKHGTFLLNLFDLLSLYTEDYWNLIYSQEQEAILYQNLTDAYDEIKDILNVLKMRDDLSNSEFVLRHRDEYGSVITDETTQVNEDYKRSMFDYYAQLKYQNFIHRFHLTKYLTPEEANLNIPISKSKTALDLDKEIAMAIHKLHLKGTDPSCTVDYFQKINDKLADHHGKYNPLYEFNKLVVPAMNELIEDHAHEKYKKKDKHMLLFSMLRLFRFVPNKPNLDIFKGSEDAKEDFIKQLIRKDKK